jgi:hypothetical protein
MMSMAPAVPGPAAPAMDRHLNLLGILHQIWGALSLVVGVSILVLALGATAIIAKGDPMGHPAGLAARITTLTFFLLGAIGAAWGAIHASAGYALRRRRPWARLVALGLAVLNLFFLPFGTAFGIYSLWVLLTERGRRLFEHSAAAGAGSTAG